MFEEFLGGKPPLDFDELADHLVEQGQTISPSKLHGAVCGLLVGDVRLDAEYCLAGVSQSLAVELPGALADASQRLIAGTLEALGDEEFQFHLFMPADDSELSQRVAALSQWCQGFLAGYARAVTEPATAAPGGEIAEVLRDISAIAEAQPDVEEEDAESAEQDLFELTEYLRFATLNVYQAARERQGLDD